MTSQASPLQTLNPTATPHLERQAVRLQRAGRTVFQLALDAQTFGDRIPQSPSTIPSGAQRAFDAGHARRIYRYILDNPDTWAFNPIIVAAHSGDVDWEPIAGTDPGDLIQNGVLRLAAGSMDRMRILDGQHRRAAIQDVLRVTPSTRTARKLLSAQDSLHRSVISVEMYVIDDDNEVKQIFADMARQRSISASTRAYMDQRDPYNAAAVRMLRERSGVSWLRRLVPPIDAVRQQIRTGSPFWLNAAAVARTVRFRDIGDHRLKATLRDHEDYAPVRIDERVRPFFERELPSLRTEWQEATSRQFDPAIIATGRDFTVVFAPTLVYAAALALKKWSEEDRGDIAPLAERFQSLNLSSDRGEISEDLGPFLTPTSERATLQMRYAGNIARMLVEAAV